MQAWRVKPSLVTRAVAAGGRAFGGGGSDPSAMMNAIMNQAAGGNRGGHQPQTTAGGNTPQQQQQNPFSGLMSMFEEREWECWCGHKFRAPGEWVPCAPVSCMAPGCPNPNYFIEGEGRQLLERQNNGERILPPSQRAGGSTSQQQQQLGHHGQQQSRHDDDADVLHMPPPPSAEGTRTASHAANPNVSSADLAAIPQTREELAGKSVRELKALLMNVTGKSDPKFAEKSDYVDAVWKLRP